MPRFFFVLIDGDEIDEDLEGIDLPDAGAAYQETLRAAREMMIEDLALAKPLHEKAFEVSDESGCLLFRVDFKDVLHV
ncbi:DUF6894 family protein [Rhizobium sp. PL01]|uniref:DUF6894 family protein n=1 Tax=Rhizobium sp. PL01 TaxID=3085631 RepID=UPI0029828EB8|nr:hypothetical protein [Rhizobium sp. PL01]MDW5316840.1 hypothetical protein [Rhizobium sp. PL01]